MFARDKEAARVQDYHLTIPDRFLASHHTFHKANIGRRYDEAQDITGKDQDTRNDGQRRAT